MHKPKKDKWVGTRMTSTMYEKLELVSNAKEWSIAKTIRKILEDYLR